MADSDPATNNAGRLARDIDLQTPA